MLSSYTADKFTDVEFMTAAEKARVAKQWERFLADNMSADKFTKALYEHLHGHCNHIAHYDRGGFYAEWFSTPERRIEFMQQWARDYQSGRFGWGAGRDYDDLHAVMFDSLVKHADRLAALARHAEEENLREHIARSQAKLDAMQGGAS